MTPCQAQQTSRARKSMFTTPCGLATNRHVMFPFFPPPLFFNVSNFHHAMGTFFDKLTREKSEVTFQSV